MGRTRRASLALALGALSGAASLPVRGRAATPGLTVGTLQFGTVMWELDTLRHHGLDAAAGFTLTVQPFGGNDAADVALMGRAVDTIVEDWLWVGRQRNDGAMLTFIPYSSSVGAVMVRADSPAKSLEDLAGKRLGIAGGPFDKSWLILQGYATRVLGFELAKQVEPVFAAPPLLNEKLKSGELDAVVNYWNWCARLEAQGARRMIGVADAMAALGVPATTPQLGYIFRENWAAENAQLVQAFAGASRAAKQILATSDAEWDRLRPLTRAEDAATQAAFMRRFREGIIGRWGAAERADAARLFALLAELGGERLVGPKRELPAGTFWEGVSY